MHEQHAEGSEQTLRTNCLHGGYMELLTAILNHTKSHQLSLSACPLLRLQGPHQQLWQGKEVSR